MAELDGTGPDVPLPDAEISLTDVATGVAAARVLTDLGGRYLIQPPAPGTYRLCWQRAGWVPGCRAEPVHADDTLRRLEPVRLEPDPGPDARGQPLGVLRGRVALLDGSRCGLIDGFFGAAITREVSASISGEGLALGPVRANAWGEYVLAGVPRGDVRLEAHCDRGEGTSTVPASAFAADGIATADLRIGNSAPRLPALVPIQGGKLIRRAAPGTTVSVVAVATDAEDDSLHFEWRVLPGSGTLAGSGAGVEWMLPPERGLHVLYVMVSDGRGGVALRRLSLPTGVDPALFSGTVTAVDGSPLPDATVAVNGATVVTDPRGAFSLSAPPGDQDRYVLTVRKFGYAPLSRILEDGVAGGRWSLRDIQVTTIDPTRAVDVFDGGRRPGRARGGGIRVRIRPNSLVDDAGRPARGRLRMAVGTLDPSGEPLPGSGRGIDGSGRTVSLTPFGVSFFEVLDDSGNRYHLAPGAGATVTLPLFPEQLDAPETVPLWRYDPDTGYWREVGTARRASPDYDYDAADSDMTTPAVPDYLSAGCLNVLVDKTLKAGLTLRVKGPLVTTDHILDSNFPTFIMTTGSPVALTVLAPNGGVFPVTFKKGSQVLAGGLVSPGDPLTGADFPEGLVAPPWVVLPICDTYVSATLGVPPWSGFPGSNFLSILFVNSPDADVFKVEPDAYYAAVDPDSLRTTLGAWWGVNGFGADGSGGLRASYLSDNDLGLGVDNHCMQSGQDAACYQTLYGDPDRDPGNADLARNQTKSQASVTLAMEFRAIEGQPSSSRIVKFFVFQGGDPAGTRTTTVDLDGFGPKRAPRVCLHCHGEGTPPAPLGQIGNSVVDLGSSFREYDRAVSIAPSGVSPGALESALHDANQLVKQTDDRPLRNELIDGWYASGSTQDADFVTSGWLGSAAEQNFYRQVLAKSCRTCHIALPGRDWQTLEVLASEGSYGWVCAFSMPHALPAYLNFWRSGRAKLMGDFFTTEVPDEHKWPAPCLTP